MPKVFKKDSFIERAEVIHGKKYDYSGIDKIKIKEGAARKIKLRQIRCRDHGIFWQETGNHLAGKGCNVCGRNKAAAHKKDSTKDFITKAKALHGDFYIYKSVEYIDCKTNVFITCREHGNFAQRPNNHLNGKGCPQCAIEARPEYKTIDREALLATGLRFKTKLPDSVYHAMCVTVECDIHGELTVKANSAIKGCYLCARSKSYLAAHALQIGKYTTDFAATMFELYGDQYDCSKVVYTTARHPVILICKDHGEFQSSPNAATSGKSTTGVVRMPCKECRGSGRIKRVEIEGKSFEYRGYEALALKVIVDKGIDVDDIVVGSKVPKIPLGFKTAEGKPARHWPDIYIKSRNMIIEVKSTGTFGLTPYHGNIDAKLKLIQHKSRCAKQLGYDYRVMLFTGKKGKNRLALPEGWDRMSVAKIRNWFSSI